MSVFIDWLQRRDKVFAQMILEAQHMAVDGKFRGGQVSLGPEESMTILTEASAALAVDLMSGVAAAGEVVPAGGPREAMAVEASCRHIMAAVLWGMRLAATHRAELHEGILDSKGSLAPQ